MHPGRSTQLLRVVLLVLALVFPDTTGVPSAAGSIGKEPTAFKPAARRAAIAAANTTGPVFPSNPSASLAFNLSGTWQTRAWSTVKPFPFAPDFDDSGLITFKQRGLSLTGSFTVTTHVPASTGTLAGTVAPSGEVRFSYTVTAGAPQFVGRTQSVVARVQPNGLLISGRWSESSGYAGQYYAFNQQVSARALAHSFGQASDVCGHNNACPYGLDPINLATGNAVWQETDLQVAAPGAPFAWQRTYNSRNPRSGILGQGWSSNLDARLDLSAPGQVTLIAENGAESTYTISGTALLRPQAELAQLTQEPDGSYRLVRPDQSVLRFSSAGRLTAQLDKAGRGTHLHYTAGLLSGLTDSAGRSYSLTTDAQGRVTRLTEAALGRTLAYTYTAGLLTEFSNPLGETKHYSYTTGFLSAVTLADGSVRVRNRYDSQGRAVWQHEWGSTPVTITYDLAIPPITATLTLTTTPSGPVTVVVSQPVKRTRSEDATGRTVLYDYDGAGRLLRLIDPQGRATLYTYTGSDQLALAKDPLGNSGALTYDAEGNILQVQNALGEPQDFAYDSRNQLVAERDALGRTTAYTYTAEGLLRQTTDPLGATTLYTYTTLVLGGVNTPMRSAVQDQRGLVTSYGYTPLGQVAAITDALGLVTRFEYDAAGRLVRTVDQTGVATCQEYDAANRLTAAVQNCRTGEPASASVNVRTEYGYDTLGRRIWERSPLSQVTRTFFDDQGRATRVVAGCAQSGASSTAACDTFSPLTPHLNRTTSYGYDALGRQALITDTLGIVTETVYDQLNRPVRRIRNRVPGGPVDATTNISTTFEYDAAGHKTAETDPLGRRTVYTYDGAGRLASTIRSYQDGNPLTGARDRDLVSRTLYNAQGLPVRLIENYVDGQWSSIRPDEDVASVTLYDDLQRPIAQISAYVDGVAAPGETATDRITEYRYDALGNRTAVIDPLGRVTVTRYDALDRVVEVIQNCTDGAGQPRESDCASGHGPHNDQNLRTVRTYTARGELSTQTDPAGRVTAYTYDALGRLLESTANAGGPAAPADVATAYAYNALGNTTLITDALGFVERASFNQAGWPVERYDKAGRLQQYSFDGLGRVVAQTDALGRVQRTGYDPLGRTVTSVLNWQNGAAEPTDQPDEDLITGFGYDAAGRQVELTDAAGRRTLLRYDPLDRLVGVVENAGGAVAPADVATGYGYDRLGRTTVITDALGRVRRNSYDAAGQVISQTDPLGRVTSRAYDRGGRRTSQTDARPVTAQLSYDSLDRPIAISAAGMTTISMTYDLAGRRTQLADATGTTAYQFDALDRMTGISAPQTGAVGYGYDLLGRRTRLVYPDASAVDYTYLPDGSLDTVIQGGALLADYSYDAVGRVEQIARANGATTLHTYDAADRLRDLRTDSVGGLVSRIQYGVSRIGLRTSAIETLAASPAAGAFLPSSNLSTGAAPYSLAAADFNGDGQIDITTSSLSTSSLSVLLGSGGGTFQAASGRAAGATTRAVLAGDFDADGAADLAAASSTTNSVRVLLGNGDGTFQTAAAYTVGSGPSALAAADLNGDGTLDLATANINASGNSLGSVSVLLGNGDGTFQAAANLTAGISPAAVAIADINGDTHPDLVVANQTSDTVSVLLGNGDGTFQAAANTAVGSSPRSLAVADINHDGRRDVLVGNNGSASVSVLLGQPSGTISATATYTVGLGPSSLALADTNRDGHTDLVSANTNSSNLTLRLGNGDGTFQAAATLSLGQTPRAVIAQDLTGDGAVDLAVVQSSNNAIGLLSNQLVWSAPLTRSLSYSYDGLARLSAVSGTGAPGATYSYDLVGNRTDGGSSYDAADQVVGWQYDGAGNLLSDGSASYTYDPLGRLASSSVLSRTAVYSYNGDGVLVERTVGGATTRYAQDLAAPLSQVLQTSGDASASYLYGAERLAARETDTTTWMLGDGLGSVRQTLDMGGLPLGPVSYDPWGEVQSGNPPAFGFAGELSDADGSLIYLRSRWYAAGEGRFLTQDSFPGVLASPQSLHRYAYTNNSPLTFIDPSGRYPCDGIEQVATTTIMWPSEYARFCEQQRDALKNSPQHNQYQALRGSNMLESMIYLFTENTLPGGSRAAVNGSNLDMTIVSSGGWPVTLPHRRTAAQERLEFVLWITRTGDPSIGNAYTGGGQFNSDFVTTTDPNARGRNDSGFAAEFQDGGLWTRSSSQVGHFLTAVQMGYQSQELAACAIGHELSGDDTDHAVQCAQGIGQVGRFNRAIEADAAGDYVLRDCLISQMLGNLPEQFDPKDYQSRAGNSWQDTRLTIRGWRFGDMIRRKQITTLKQSGDWLRANLAP
ncbi:MAG TPA: FG-GAP-like repeat-containing protein [Roseiflexaceae bacterium]|nr:FG-GAP-like repeat-containing protein [Roseiflexaceae bacterium]